MQSPQWIAALHDCSIRTQIFIKRNRLWHATMSLAGIWYGNFCQLRNTLTSCHRSKLLCTFVTSSQTVTNGGSLNYQPPLTTVLARTGEPESRKAFEIGVAPLDGAVTRSPKLKPKKLETSSPGYKIIQYCDIKENAVNCTEAGKVVTVLVIDIETTGFCRKRDRIIEFAVQDLRGGKNSTFRTLVNPGRPVFNSHIHGIRSHMVNRPDVPRWKDLAPILLHYIRSRQIDGGPVLLVAHNGRSFDVPFIVREFARCSIDIPSDWRFLDTLPLARELVKPDGSKLSSCNLQALREHYGISLDGTAHRAMSDVNLLSLVLQRITFDKKLSVSDLLERSFIVQI